MAETLTLTNSEQQRAEQLTRCAKLCPWFGKMAYDRCAADIKPKRFPAPGHVKAMEGCEIRLRQHHAPNPDGTTFKDEAYPPLSYQRKPRD